MSEPETIEGEVAEVITTAVAQYEAPPPANLFRTDDPTEIVRKATAIADALSEVLRQKKLTTKIGKGEHVRVEGWTLLGTMLGVFPVLEWTRPVQDGWEARVVATTMVGAVVGAAEAECLRSEARWKSADDYAIRSMAQTRATSKALRQPLGFVVNLAGFEATPAEEMTFERDSGSAYHEPKPVEPAPFAPKSWKALNEALTSMYGEASAADFTAFGSQAMTYLFGAEELTQAQKDALWQISLTAARHLHDNINRDFPPPARDEMRTAWREAMAVDEDLEGPAWRMSPDETDREPKA